MFVVKVNVTFVHKLHLDQVFYCKQMFVMTQRQNIDAVFYLGIEFYFETNNKKRVVFFFLMDRTLLLSLPFYIYGLQVFFI